VLKGPGLARTIYPSPSHRPYDDIDLTVAPTDEEAACEELTALGFSELKDEAEAAWQSRVGSVPGTVGYHRRFQADGGIVELHTEPLQLGLPPLCEDGRWERANQMPGLPHCLMLGPEDQLVQLSVHAQKHGFSRLIWLKDLDLLLNAYATKLDWELIQRVSHEEGVASSVWYALHLTRLLLGTNVPPAAMDALSPSPWTQALCNCIWPVEALAELQGQMRRRAVQFRGADGWRGMLPTMLVMGRRKARVQATVQVGKRHLCDLRYKSKSGIASRTQALRKEFLGTVSGRT
jgi:Uncharacterised nucleotidyltransferase